MNYIRSDNFLVVLLSALTLCMGSILAYVLYTTYPNTPTFKVQEEGYKVSLTAEGFLDVHGPIEVLRDTIAVKTLNNLRNEDDRFLEYLAPGEYVYTVYYTAYNMLGMDRRMEEKIPFTVKKITNTALADFYDFPKVHFTNQGYAVYVSVPDMKTFSSLGIFEDEKLIKSISKEEATTTIFLGYFSSGVHSFEIAFMNGELQALHDLLRQDYEVDVGAIAALREEGHKVIVTIQNIEGLTSPVIISRDGKNIKAYRAKGEYVLEYLKSGEYTYGIGYNIRDALSGEGKRLEVTKRLSVGEYTREELASYYGFPAIDFVTEQYSVFASSSNTQNFSTIKVFEGGRFIANLSLKNRGKTFLEHLPLGKHTLEVVFVNPATKNIEELLRKDYEAEVVPIKPGIESIALTPLDQGYASDATVTVLNAATCTADLLLQPLKGSRATTSSILKSYAFRSGTGFDYFSPYTEKWTWKEVLFSVPTSTSTAKYHIDMRVTCHDYYNATSTEAVQKLQTADPVTEDSIAITYVHSTTTTSTTTITVVTGEIYNTIHNDFSCTLLLSDDESNDVDKKEFSLLGLQTYQFDVSAYGKDLLNITAICDDEAGNHVVETSQFKR